MCSTFKYKNVMGRNYDYEQSFKEEVIFIPRGEIICNSNYDILGIGSGLFKEYPMLYDGMNSEGLCCSGLAFTGNAEYYTFRNDTLNVPAYKVIPYILGHYHSVKDFKDTVNFDFNITDTPFSKEVGNAELHWFLCDGEDALVIESTKCGVNIYDNPLEAMTNNPPFNVARPVYTALTRNIGEYDLHYGTRGKETFGIMGDYTSLSRLVRLIWLKKHLETYDMADPVTDGFKLCSSVEQLYGLTPVNDRFEYTIYKCIYDMDNLKLHTQMYAENESREWDFGVADTICRWEL